MDQTQQKALNALEPYILLSKSATSPLAAIDLITQATSAPNTFFFAELLQTPNIQSLRTASAEQAQYLTLLEIFAWGTWADYTSNSSLPPLTEPQSHKLRQLSLLTLSTSHKTLTYPHLLTALSLTSTRTLEDIVISSIYAGLLTAKLDPLSQRVDVSSVAPLRDLRPNSIPPMIAVLDDWDSRCVSVLGEVEEQVREVRRKAAERRKGEREHERAVMAAMGEDGSRDKGKALGKRVAGDGEMRDGYDAERGEDMDVDESLGRGGARNAKRGGGRFALGKRFNR